MRIYAKQPQFILSNEKLQKMQRAKTLSSELLQFESKPSTSQPRQARLKTVFYPPKPLARTNSKGNKAQKQLGPTFRNATKQDRVQSQAQGKNHTNLGSYKKFQNYMNVETNKRSSSDDKLGQNKPTQAAGKGSLVERFHRKTKTDRQLTTQSKEANHKNFSAYYRLPGASKLSFQGFSANKAEQDKKSVLKSKILQVANFDILADFKTESEIQSKWKALDIKRIISKTCTQYASLQQTQPTDLTINPVAVPEIPAPPHKSQGLHLYLDRVAKLASALSLQVQTLGLVITRYNNGIAFKTKDSRRVVWSFDGRLYVGEWDDGAQGGHKHGQGLEFSQGLFYSGGYLHGERHGFGVAVYGNGDVYEGQWQCGKRQGSGTYFSKADFRYYRGQWLRGRLEGQAIIKYSKKHYYVGQVRSNLRDGLGVELFENGDIFRGNYHEDQREGYGTEYLKNGETYLGYFRKSRRNGLGLLILPVDKQSPAAGRYVNYGIFRDGLLSGYGISHQTDQTLYYGYFYQGFFHGPGVICSQGKHGQSGVKIVGFWKSGIMVRRSRPVDQTEASFQIEHMLE